MSEADRWRGSRGGGNREEEQEKKKKETREERECENAWSQWWAVGARTQQLTNIRASQTSAALHLFGLPLPWQRACTSPR